MKAPVEGCRGGLLQAGGPQRRFMDGERRMQSWLETVAVVTNVEEEEEEEMRVL